MGNSVAFQSGSDTYYLIFGKSLKPFSFHFLKYIRVIPICLAGFLRISSDKVSKTAPVIQQVLNTCQFPETWLSFTPPPPHPPPAAFLPNAQGLNQTPLLLPKHYKVILISFLLSTRVLR